MNKPQLSLPLLRFKGFEGEWELINLNAISNIKKGKGIAKTSIIENGINKCIVYGELFTTYKSVINSIHSKTNDIGYLSKSNSLLFPSSSTSLKDYFPCSSLKNENVHLGGDINIFEIDYKNDSDCLAFMFSSKKHLENIFTLTRGVTINHLYSNDIKKYNFYFPSLTEQQKIAKFFSLLDKQISLWERKLELYELFYKHIKQLSLKNIEKFNDKKSFNEVFLETKEVNKNNFSQYTVGKHSIQKIEKTNYDLSNHKIFTINNLLLGIGIEEVQFNLHINNGCCSPIYKVYNLINKELNQYFYLFLKDILIKNKAFISRKSTRRNYEFLYKDLLSFNLPIPDFNFKKNITTLMKIENILELVTNSLNIYKNKKCFFLSKLFI